MGLITGVRVVEIEAAVARCFAIAADIENAIAWQAALRDVDVLERDTERRALVAETESDAKVRTVRARLRFAYAPHTEIRWVQERGDTKSLEGSWTFAELGAGRTRASYALAVDPGRMLGLLLRGPAEGKVRDFLLGGAAEGLKSRAEASG